MTKVQGRVLKPPVLKLKARGLNGQVVQVSVDKQRCGWNLVDKAVVEAVSIQTWGVLDFTSSSGRFGSFNPDQVIPKFIQRCQSLGIRVMEPVLYENTSMSIFQNVDAIRQLLDKVVHKQAKASLQILVCVMAKEDPGYNYLKWYTETKLGLLTQCCLSTSANNVKGQDQYLANLALKINAKLGGSNFELVDALPNIGGQKHVMFIGADVNHPGSGNRTSPSIAAVVATMNWPAANRYAARVWPQEHRKENIVRFGEKCLELVKAYVELNKVKPAKIVVFRDGVSEGQFDMALNTELMDLKKAFREMNYFPTITLIVAQKRHHARLFLDNSTYNVPPGTVVDTGITHQTDFDCYLNSHYGNIGTSKPTHYQVLLDEHKFNSNDLQQLIYNLCFTFARCSKPVSLVPPVYYADLLAYRGQLYHKALLLVHHEEASFDERNYKVHPSIENSMFFI
jgi:eukaryotic translation initiation factor 2C